jgi:hypothetical protein
MQAMRDIQSSSAMIVFMMVHIPLAKISSAFSCLTALIPMILDKRNKENIYLAIHAISYANNNGLG